MNSIPKEAGSRRISPFCSFERSLSDILGNAFIRAVVDARAFATGISREIFAEVGDERVDLMPLEGRGRIGELLRRVGEKVCQPLTDSIRGAATQSFNASTNRERSPLSALGAFRIGEDGRLYLAAKSEHYHASLGHDFPGYRLIENAKRLGIPNITHNNTRGFVTRLLEEELIGAAHGILHEDQQALERVLSSSEPHVLNRVCNLQTGSLAAEAAVKMMLARFYRLEEDSRDPPHVDRIPVFLVVGDQDSGINANYHGTTVLTQIMRGIWPRLRVKLEEKGVLLVRGIAPNDISHFRKTLDAYEKPPYKVAGFLHEIILMNYGALRLHRDYLMQVYESCQASDVPVLVDEIQSCAWSPELFLFREYELRPDFVCIGKGMSGGQYPDSRVITTAPMDNLSQFGALVTNGQQELGSLAYLITIEFIRTNAHALKEVGNHYYESLEWLGHTHRDTILKVEGLRHLAGLHFQTTEKAKRFAQILNDQGIDISAQTYKTECPPAVLTKLPLIATPELIDCLIEKMDRALKKL